MSFNIVISLAGKSQRFFNEGFTQPKYLLPMPDGKTMIEHSIDTLHISGQLILIVQKEHCEKFKIDSFLKEKYPSCMIRYLDFYTQGAAESVYLATKDLIDNTTPLLITNCDQTLEWDSTDFVKKTLETDGCVLTYKSDLQKNSYAKVESYSTRIIQLAEKEVISEHSLVGVHSWKKGSDFCRSAEHLFKHNLRANNEFYISISYNPLIHEGKEIHIVSLKENERFHPVGTPEQYYEYLQLKYGSIKSKETLDNMKRGWLVGNFEPSILRTEQFEVAYMRHKKGEYWPPHLHKEISEYNVLIRGKMKMNNEIINEGDVFIIPKTMLTHAVFLEDCEVLCIKVPSVPTDKLCY